MRVTLIVSKTSLEKTDKILGLQHKLMKLCVILFPFDSLLEDTI